MSLFDLPNKEKLQDVYPDESPFILYSVTYEGVKDTEYGPSHQATVSVGPVDKKTPPVDFKVFGRLAEQTRGVHRDDLPTMVKVAQVGRGYAWAKTDPGEVPF